MLRCPGLPGEPLPWLCSSCSTKAKADVDTAREECLSLWMSKGCTSVWILVRQSCRAEKNPKYFCAGFTQHKGWKNNKSSLCHKLHKALGSSSFLKLPQNLCSPFSTLIGFWSYIPWERKVRQNRKHDKINFPRRLYIQNPKPSSSWALNQIFKKLFCM